ncbi:MAG: hypothetical protein CVU77_04280 [Elusimicrobia bacterium HGW-Elusimicrobia-1]|jgi:HEAT repeat protein|nr:MAG: hypothetical protein CVU77_04280 [Elusimicrobia bacterium HGW-Elusimicrobia-1]
MKNKFNLCSVTLSSALIVGIILPGFCSISSAAALSERMVSDDYTIRNSAEEELEKLDAVAKKKIVSELILFLKDKNLVKAEHAAETLGKLGPAAEKSVPALLGALKPGNPTGLRAASAKALGKIGAVNKGVVPELIRCLKEKPTDYLDLGYHQAASAKALGNIRPVSPKVVPALIEALENTEAASFPSLAIMKAIGEIGPEAKEAIPILIQCLGSTLMCSYAAMALIQIGPDAVPPLIKALENDDYHVRQWAAITLGGRFGSNAQKAAPFLIKALKDMDSAVRSAAAYSLGNIAPATPEAVSALIGALGDEDPHVRQSAIDGLININKIAMDSFIENLDKNKELEQSEKVIDHIQGALAEALKNKNPYVRQGAVEVVGRIGSLEKETIAAVMILLNDPDVSVRRAASEALEKAEDPGAREALKAYKKEEEARIKKKISEISSDEIKDVVITLKKTAGYVPCRAYKLTVYGRGEVVFDIGPEPFTRASWKTRKANISKEKIKQLIIEFEKINYYSLKDSYEKYIVTDLPYVITSIIMRGKTKTIVHYLGDTGAPDELRRLEDKIDEITNSEQWVK